MTQPASSTPVWLVNGRFADVISGEYFPLGTSLVVQNGKIAAMPGPGAPTTQADCLIIDLGGRVVIPGLFNTHTHLQIINGLMDKGDLRQRQIAKNLADCLERGVTNVRDALCWDLPSNREIIEQIAHRSLPGPRIYQAIHVSPLGGTYAPRQNLATRALFGLLGLPMPSYKGTDSGVVTFRPSASLAEVRAAVDRAIDERGAEMIKFCDQREHFMSYKPGAAVITPEHLEVAVDQARKRGIATTIHCVTVDGFRSAVRAGITSLAHVPSDGALEESDLRLFADAQALIEPTLTVAYYYTHNLKGSPWRGHAEINRLEAFRADTYRAMVEESWLPEARKGFFAQAEAIQTGQIKLLGLFDLSAPYRYFAALMPVGGQNYARLYQAGGRERSACGTDATVSPCSQSAIHLELELFDFLLNRDEQVQFCGADALRIATIQSARALALDDRFGSLTPGKVADLVVLDGDPFADYHVIGKQVEALFMDGKLVIDRCGLGK